MRYNFLLYIARVVATLAPLACVILVCVHIPPLMQQGRIYWTWKFALTAHCIYIIFNLFTMRHINRFILLFIVGWYYLFCIYSSLGFVILVGMRALKISKFDCYVAIIPLVGCGVWTSLGGNWCYRKLNSLGYRHWLSTFDRDWRPEKTKWWWRPVNVRESVKRLKGHWAV